MSETVLIVDDDPVQRRLLEAMVAALRLPGAHRRGRRRGGLALLTGRGRTRIDCVVLDLVMPDLDGLGVLARMREAGCDTPVIVQTAHGGIDNVVSAMRAGAADFVVKPAGAERLQVSLRNALADAARWPANCSASSAAATARSRIADVITRSAAMQPVLHAAEKAAASAIPVLIEGESGIGKELIARAIHGSGARRAKPFVAVNCGAMPENLVESILFGHEKGAFTGATEKHTGKFVEADGGTLFLDEVGELPPPAQVKLLRALQEGEVEPVGGAQDREGRRAHHLRHQPRPDRRREGRALPRGPVLPPARVSDFGAAAARGGRRTFPNWPAISSPASPPRKASACARLSARGAGAARRLSLAGQCAPARERDLPRGGARRRRGASASTNSRKSRRSSGPTPRQPPMIEPSPAMAAAWPDAREAAEFAAH